MFLRFIEKMIGILYIILIVGWIILVIALKCKRIHQRQPPHCDTSTNQPIHVIQIDPSLYESVRSNRSWRTIAAHTNQAYLPDDATYTPPPNVFAPPPSYEEVMRATHIYPKRDIIPGSISTGSFKPNDTEENDHHIETISTSNMDYSCSSSRASSSGASTSTSTVGINGNQHSALNRH